MRESTPRTPSDALEAAIERLREGTVHEGREDWLALPQEHGRAILDALARLTASRDDYKECYHELHVEVARLTERNQALEAHLKGAFREGYYAGWRERDVDGGYHACGPEFCWRQSDARHLVTDTEAPHGRDS